MWKEWSCSTTIWGVFVFWVMLQSACPSPLLALPVLSGDTDVPELSLDDDTREQHIEYIKKSILDSLGMKRVPDMRKVNVSQEEIDQMIAVYERNKHFGDDEEEGEDHNEAIERYHAYQDQSSVFFNPEAPMKLANSTDQLLYFPIGRTGTLNSSTNIKVTSAKLRVFKKKIHALPSGNHSSSTKAAIVCVYQLSEDLSTEKNFQDVARKLVALQSITLDGRNSWENFDISQTVQEWLEKPQTNFGLVLACPDCHLAGYFFHSTTHNPHKVLPCNSCHEMNNSQSNVDFQKNVAVLDVLVKELSQQRDKRSTMPNFNANPKSLDCTRGNKTRLCCRYSLVVSFKDIGWDWVVKPEKYKAHFCKGKCPVRQNKMYSNPHALIQSMMRVKGLARVPRPCCTPKKLGSLSLLHYNDHETPQLVVTRRKGMKVRTCGCS